MTETTLSHPIGTYWYGPALGPLERACLISMMEQGHSVTLFCHKRVDRVPEGVEIQDAREITGDRPVLIFRRKSHKTGLTSPALFANQFRYHMIQQTGWIWLDLDVFLFKPLRPNAGYLLGWEDSNFVNNAILALPKSSSTLKDLIAFTENEYPIPPFFDFRRKVRLHLGKTIGKPVHVCDQPWGVWGPSALTWFLYKNQEVRHVWDRELLYPIECSKHLDPLFLPINQISDLYLKDALCVHLWNKMLTRKLKKIDHIPEGSLLHEIMEIGS